jgi:hypothetical protein
MAKVKASRNKAKDTEGMKIELSIRDRLVLIDSVLPKEGDIVSLTIARDIGRKVELTQAEMGKYKVKTIPSKDGKSSLTWDEKGQKKKIALTNAEIDFLKERVNVLDKQKKVTSDMLSLCLIVRG